MFRVHPSPPSCDGCHCGNQRRARLDFRLCHRPVVPASECGGPKDDRAATGLAAPAVALQHFGVEFAIRIRVQPKPRSKDTSVVRFTRLGASIARLALCRTAVAAPGKFGAIFLGTFF